MFGSTASKSMTGAAELYIRNTKPREEPVKFSPGQKESIRQVHNVSAKGVKVTKKTLDTVNNVRPLGAACGVKLTDSSPGDRTSGRKGRR